MSHAHHVTLPIASFVAPEFGGFDPYCVMVSDGMGGHGMGMMGGMGSGHRSAAPIGMLENTRPSETAYVHDPYSFASYAVAHISFECSDYSSNDSSDSFSPARDGSHDQYTFDSTESDEDHHSCMHRRKHVAPPCGHEQYKRLRFKKGLSHFLCIVCSTKWKQSGV